MLTFRNALLALGKVYGPWCNDDYMSIALCKGSIMPLQVYLYLGDSAWFLFFFHTISIHDSIHVCLDSVLLFHIIILPLVIDARGWLTG